MLTLNRLYSETGLFDEVRFHPGINVVLGKYSGAERSVNGIGKSTLVRLVDFAFLASTPGALAPEKNKFLQDHNVILEFTLGGSVFEIKRSFSDLRVAYFGEKGASLTDYTVQELRDVLGTKFFMSGLYPGAYATSQWFRSLMRFFIKDDIDRRRQDQPVNFVSPTTRATESLCYNFFLLGIPNSHLYEFDRVREETRQRQVARKDLEDQIERDSQRSVGELRREASRVRERISQLEVSLQEFAFIESYKDAEDELTSLSREVSGQLSTYHALRTTLERHLDSYRVVIEVDVARIAHLYREYSQQLGEFVQKTLDEVIRFRQQIAENRRRFLAERERDLRIAIEGVLKEISFLEGRRQRLYRLLQEAGAFDSIRHTYEQLIEERVSLERDNALLLRLSELEASLAELKARAAELTRAIIEDVQQSEYLINGLRLLFDEILENAFFVNETERGGYLDIRATSSQTAPASITVNVPKSASLGKYVFGILAYDLTAFLNIVRKERRLPTFLIHDGVFHGIDTKTVVNVLNYVHRQSLLTPGFQYIITANEDELFIASSKEEIYGKYEFDLERSTIVTYEDTPDRMIFKRDFR